MEEFEKILRDQKAKLIYHLHKQETRKVYQHFQVDVAKGVMVNILITSSQKMNEWSTFTFNLNYKFFVLFFKSK